MLIKIKIYSVIHLSVQQCIAHQCQHHILVPVAASDISVQHLHIVKDLEW